MKEIIQIFYKISAEQDTSEIVENIAIEDRRINY
jgi:hypothetical protein